MYLYGMRLRGFSIGCQPADGFLKRMDDVSGKYYDIIAFDCKMTDSKLENYELDYIGRGEENESTDPENNFRRF